MTRRRLAKTVAIIAVVVLFGWCVSQLAVARMQIAFAEEQVTVFEQMERKARSSSTQGAVECLEYVLNYYPSGTKQTPGSKLDKKVEEARHKAASAIVADLRSRGGTDLGDDPLSWIEGK